MTKTQVEVITSVERRRRWSRAEKERIVAAALEPGAVASAVAREAGIHASQLYRWRQELCGPARAAAGFTAVTIAADPEAVRAPVVGAGAVTVAYRGAKPLRGRHQTPRPPEAQSDGFEREMFKQ
jgi:transposase